MEKTCQAVLPLRTKLHICQHFVYIAPQLVRGGGGSFHFQLETSHWKESFAGVQHFSSPLLMKPLTYFSLHDLFEQVLGSCGREVLPGPPSPGPQSGPAARRSAERRFEFPHRLAGAHPLYG